MYDETTLTDTDLKLMLKSFVSNGSYERTKYFLNRHSDRINASSDCASEGEEGILFGFALLHKSPKLLKLLIDNYVEIVINKKDSEQEKQVAKQKLSQMLQTQINEALSDRDYIFPEHQTLLTDLVSIPTNPEQDLTGFDPEILKADSYSEFN